ncbi:hypothetical protein TURU_013896 [Turdus rufiventris]|nr:hypothetical protein TURU_013896 [Turdus rufiventris]
MHSAFGKLQHAYHTKPAQERHGTVGASPEEDHEADKGTKRTSALRELQLLILEKKRLHDDLLATFQCVKGPTEKLKDFSPGTVATGQGVRNVFSLKERKFSQAVILTVLLEKGIEQGETKYGYSCL